MAGDPHNFGGTRPDAGTGCHATPRDSSGSVVRPAGIEPATYGFEVRRSVQLSYGRADRSPLSTSPRLGFRGGAWGERRDLNPQPLEPQSSALTIELRSPSWLRATRVRRGPGPVNANGLGTSGMPAGARGNAVASAWRWDAAPSRGDGQVGPAAGKRPGSRSYRCLHPPQQK